MTENLHQCRRQRFVIRQEQTVGNRIIYNLEKKYQFFRLSDYSRFACDMRIADRCYLENKTLVFYVKNVLIYKIPILLGCLLQFTGQNIFLHVNLGMHFSAL